MYLCIKRITNTRQQRVALESIEETTSKRTLLYWILSTPLLNLRNVTAFNATKTKENS